MTSESDKLEEFYAFIKDGCSVAEFLARYDAIFPYIHGVGLTEDFRLGKGRTKKLRDEIRPVHRFVKVHAKPDDRIRFSLDDSAPDCHFYRHSNDKEYGIEVTIAQGKAQFHLATELNEQGIGPGFSNKTDDTDWHSFNRLRVCYSTDEALQTLIRSVKICVQNKSLFQGDILLIDAPLNALPRERWDTIHGTLMEKVERMGFREVYLSGHCNSEDICIPLKAPENH